MRRSNQTFSADLPCSFPRADLHCLQPGRDRYSEQGSWCKSKPGQILAEAADLGGSTLISSPTPRSLRPISANPPCRSVSRDQSGREPQPKRPNHSLPHPSCLNPGPTSPRCPGPNLAASSTKTRPAEDVSKCRGHQGGGEGCDGRQG